MGGQVPDPVAALREIAFWMERDRAQTHRVKAYRRAADVVAELPDADFERYRESGAWQELSGIGPKTAAVIQQACAGAVPQRLAELRSAAKPIAPAGGAVRALLRGDLHTHSDWSDGGSPIEEMMRTAQALGHDYCALTDHSPRLTVANGLSAERLRRQLDVVAELNERLAPFRILTGIEVDILDDGTLDQEAELLARLDIVVASVHSNLRADSETMTKRMVYAVANPNVDVLGHCTGRLVAGNRGIRPESSFDAELVFEACRRYGTAVEINSRPERLDPPSRLLRLAVEMGCYFSIDTDAHAPGQLDWQGYGCERAAANEVPADRIINSLPLSELLAFTAR
ncbi:PHP domain-containing protein [Nocardia africana]|uniref:DNA polymerase/3'-5' exonuclease PolX n=1 Tax=Nocardia africana TaxID=134964 RepID=A0A378X2A9_9NOCA|nr:PHP domain-containing protein [Nocardia africana]MCC3311938.1 PHP domain-containing protein [Nocardia africana]SUA46781.1 DNA polymerase/3'-5' exonuclease PolX [Nocardia africana]